jgi:hypothetical protein
LNDAAIKTSEVALRMSLLINGGAAVALLTFVGSLEAKQKVAIANSLVWFAAGVVLAVLAIAAAYFTHFFLAEQVNSTIRTWTHPYLQPGQKTQTYANWSLFFRIVAVVLGLASAAMFVCGVLAVRSAFLSTTIT